LARSLFVNGTGMTQLCSETKLMAHLPYLLAAERPKRMLILCFGMGTTFRSATTQYPDLQVDAVDIVPEVFAFFPHFHSDAERTRRPGAALHADDARNYLLAHPGPYDIVTMDPAPPLHSAGTVNLYTREFFALVKS